MSDFDFLVLRHKMSFTVRRPTRMDRVYFVWQHRRWIGLRAALAVISGRANNVSRPFREVIGTYYVVPGAWARRHERARITSDLYIFDDPVSHDRAAACGMEIKDTTGATMTNCASKGAAE